MSKVIVAGSRDFTDYTRMCKVLDEVIEKDDIIISGGARGADRIGEQYAHDTGLEIVVMLADWDKWGKSAGYRRNEEMAKVADGLVAFWDGNSKGTKHMIDLARKYKLQVVIDQYKETVEEPRDYYCLDKDGAKDVPGW